MIQTFWQRRMATLGITATLTSWRWHQQWFLLAITGLGILIATTLICSLPLFSSVMVTAGLRTTLRAEPDSTTIEANMGMANLSTAALNEATRQLTARFKQDLGPYLASQANLSRQIEIANWTIPGTNEQVMIHAASMSDAAPHIQVLQGHLPTDNGSTLEVALTTSAATYMGAHIGSIITLLNPVKTVPPANSSAEPQIYPQTLTFRVAGIFQTVTNDPYWQGETFQEPAPGPTGPVPFHVLISSAQFLRQIDTLAQHYQTSALSFSASITILLAYSLAPEHMYSAQLDNIIDRLRQLQVDVAQQQNTSNDLDNNQSPLVFPYIAGVTLSGATLPGSSSPDLLEAFQNEILLGQATMLILTIQIASLILFFVSILANTLIEREANAIALLRSRGASAQQILGTLLTEGIVLCLLAGIVAPPLALAVVNLSAPHLLSPTNQNALDALPDTFVALINNVGLYALTALLIGLGTLLLAFLTALRGNILTVRREAARTLHRPLWQRLRLDLALAVIALAGYGFAYYAQSTQQLLDAQSQQLLLPPLNLLAPLLLLLAALLFFLRFFPAILHICMRLAAGRKGAVPLLAVAQLERAPRQPVRMTLILGLALVFAIFTLIFSASQAQRAQDLAFYQVGADFSGYLPTNLQTSNPANLAEITARYNAIAGITAASPGYAGQANLQINVGSPNEYLRPLQVRAIDPQTFARTATWSTQDSTQSLTDLLAQLVSQRKQASQQGVVPAILSASAWQDLNLHPGMIFTLFDASGMHSPIRYLAVISIAHIPPADESIESGMLVDFQTLLTAYQKQHQPLQSNYVWLHGNADPTALVQARHMLTDSSLALGSFADQRALAEANAANPLLLNLLAVLSMGSLTALLLAILANFLLPILSLRARLTSFAFLRALGADPAQVIRLLAWEQGLVLAIALVLGIGLGLAFSLIAIPPLIVSSAPIASTQPLSINTAYLLQSLIPARIVLPPSLWLALMILLALCLLTLGLIVMIALRSTMSQQLRLNED